MRALIALLFSLLPGQATAMHYTLKGSGKDTLVLIHGFGVDSSIWDHIVDKLAQSYQVLTLDLKGHGKSNKPPEGYSVELFAQDVHQLITKLNISNPIIVGWSLGGYIAQYYATHYPIKKLILVCTCPTWVPEEGFPFGGKKEDHKASFHKLLKTPTEYYEDCVKANFMDHCTETDKDAEASKLRTTLHANDKDALAAVIDYFTKEPASLIDNLSRIAVPTLIISGGQDPVSPLKAGEFMHNHIKNSQWYTIACGGHSLVQTRPKEFLRVVQSFIKGQPLGDSKCYSKAT